MSTENQTKNEQPKPVEQVAVFPKNYPNFKFLIDKLGEAKITGEVVETALIAGLNSGAEVFSMPPLIVNVEEANNHPIVVEVLNFQKGKSNDPEKPDIYFMNGPIRTILPREDGTEIKGEFAIKNQQLPDAFRMYNTLEGRTPYQRISGRNKPEEVWYILSGQQVGEGYLAVNTYAGNIEVLGNNWLKEAPKYDISPGQARWLKDRLIQGDELYGHRMNPETKERERVYLTAGKNNNIDARNDKGQKVSQNVTQLYTPNQAKGTEQVNTDATAQSTAQAVATTTTPATATTQQVTGATTATPQNSQTTADNAASLSAAMEKQNAKEKKNNQGTGGPK